MRDYFIYPNTKDYEENKKILSGQKLNSNLYSLSTFNNQNYITKTSAVDGDLGYMNYYASYYNDVLVVFSTYTDGSEADSLNSEFMSNLKILELNL